MINNHTWAHEQMTLLGLSDEARATVIRLLKAWDSRGYKGDPRIEEQLLTIFSHLARNEAVYVEGEKDDAVWVQAERGFLTVADTVRVKKDAYHSDAGQHHNGRLGRIVAIRHGDIRVRYTDGREPNPDLGVPHSPDVLEKRLK